MAKFVLQVEATYEVRVDADSYEEAEAKTRKAFDAPQVVNIDGVDAVYDFFVNDVVELTPIS